MDRHYAIPNLGSLIRFHSVEDALHPEGRLGALSAQQTR